MMKQILGLITGMLLSVLAGDLLYLYYAGLWYDPIPWIEASEIVMLYIIFVLGIIQSVVATRGLKNGIRVLLGYH